MKKVLPLASMDTVDYRTLDAAKNAFIEASRRTVRFAEKFGFVPGERFGASANLFQLDLKPFLKGGHGSLAISLVPEGLGTADDARPEDLSEEEQVVFWRNIGIKTVAVMTNDVASSGLQSILIGLYLPSSDPALVFSRAFMKGFLDGFVEGCRTVGCVYLSGETPQLKTKILPGRLDIAGAVFGVMPAGMPPIDTARMGAGNRIVFLESSGPHENGFTTLRGLAGKLPDGYRTKLRSGAEYWQALNAPSKLYTPLIQSILASGVKPTNIEPITGHGWLKLMRSEKPLKYVIEKLLPVPEIFEFVQKQSGFSAQTMLTTFNYGVGCAVFVESEKDAQKVVTICAQHGCAALDAGYVEAAPERRVVIKPLNIELSGEQFALKK